MVFRSLKKTRKKCVYFVHSCLHFLQLFSFAYTTSKPSHHNHSIIPLSNHHTIIIPKSHNLRNIKRHIYICHHKKSSSFRFTNFAPRSLLSPPQTRGREDTFYRTRYPLDSWAHARAIRYTPPVLSVVSERVVETSRRVSRDGARAFPESGGGLRRRFRSTTRRPTRAHTHTAHAERANRARTNPR